MSIKRTIAPRPTSRLQMFKVEPRFMFDGAAAVVGTEVLVPDVPESMPVLPEVPVTEIAVPDVAPAPPTEILFIDNAVTDQTTLTANTRAGIEIVTLDAQRDPWQQMTEVIAEYQNLDAVHLVSHASAGQLTFSNESPPLAKGGWGDLSGVNVGAASTFDTAQLAQWQPHLSADADILLYGCNLGAGTDGAQFIHQIADLTQADVAASTDATGSAALGGDWDLETSTGAIETPQAITAAGRDAYHALLVVNPSALTDSNAAAIRTTPEDAEIAVTGLTVTDADAPANMTLHVVTTGGTARIGGNNSADFTISGSLADVNSALATLFYKPTLDQNSSTAGFAPQIVLTATDETNTGAASLTVSNFAVTAVNDAPTFTGAVAATVQEGGTVPLDRAQLASSDNALDADIQTGQQVIAQLMVKVDSLPSGGTLTYKGGTVVIGSVVPVTELGNLKYTHDGTDITADQTVSFNVTVSDGGGGSTAGTISLTVTPKNVAPTVSGSPSLIEGQVKVVAPTIALGDGFDTLSNSTIVIGSINTGNQGTFFIDANSNNVVDTGEELTGSTTLDATQRVNLATQLKFLQNGAEPNAPTGVSAPSYQITVTDAGGGVGAGAAMTTAATITLTVTPNNDDPTLTNTHATPATALAVGEGTKSTIITSAMLQIADADRDPANLNNTTSPNQLVYTIGIRPTQGEIQVNIGGGVGPEGDGWIVLGDGGRFTQAQVSAGAVRYYQTTNVADSPNTTDQFTFTVRDSAFGYDIWTDPANPTSGREGGLRTTPIGAIALQEFDFTIAPLAASDTVRTTTYEGPPRPATSGYGGSNMTYSFTPTGGMLSNNSTATGTWVEANVGAADGGYLISNTMLSYTITRTDTKGTEATGDDVSVTVPTNETVYTLTSQPPNGKVQSKVSGNWADIPANGQFTQADIDDSKIRFVSDGSEDHASTFDYKVSDGTPNYFNSTFGLDITPTNDRPTASGGSEQVLEGNNNAVRLGSSVIGLGDVDLSDDVSKRSGEGLADFLWFKITGLAVDGSNTARGALQRWDGDSWEAVTLDTTGWLPSTLLTATADGATSGLRYVHDGSEPLAYPVNPNLTFTYLVRDDLADPNNAVATNATAPAITADTAQSNQSASATATIKIIPVNNAPQIADTPGAGDPTITGTITDGGATTGVNEILANVSEGGTSTITAAMLTAIDSDNTTVQRQFLIKSLPTLGTLLLNGKALGVGSTFTQADVDANKLVYKHNGAETPALINDALGSYNDKFHFTVSDAVFNDIGTDTPNWNSFLITFSPMNEPPTLTAPSVTVDIDSATAANNLVTGFVVADPDLTDAVTSGETDFVQATVRLLDSASAPITNYSTGFGGAGVSFGYTTQSGGLWAVTKTGSNDILQIQGTRAQVNAALAGLSVTFANDVNANYKVQVIVDDRMRDVNGALTSGADGGTQNQAATLGDAPTAVPNTVYDWSTNAAVPANDRNIVAGSVNIRASSVNEIATLTGPATATVNEDSRTLVTTGSFTVSDPESAAFNTPVTVTLSVGSGTLDVAGSGAQTTFTPIEGQAITIAGDNTASVTLTGRAADIQALLNQKNFANNAADPNGGLFFTSASNVNHDTNTGADGDVTLTLALDDVGSRIGSDVSAGSVAANPVNFTTALTITPINDAVTINNTATAVTISGSTATAVSGFVIGDVDDNDGYATGETDFVQATVRILSSTGTPLTAATYGSSQITLGTSTGGHGATVDTTLSGTNTALEVRGTLAQVNAYLAGLQVTLGNGNLDSNHSVEVVVDDRLRDANGALTSGANGGANNQQANLPVVPTTDTFDAYATAVTGYAYNVVSNTRPLFISSVNDPAAITANNVTVNEGAATLLLNATNGNFVIADSDDNSAANLSATVTVSTGTITAVGGAGGTIAGLNSATVTITGATEAQLNSRLQALTVSYPDPAGSATAADWNGSFTVTVVYNDNGNTGNRPGSLAAGSADANSGLFQYADGTSNILTTTRTITATVTGVNDAPVRSDATVVLPAGTEDLTAQPVATVTNLFSSKFNDALDSIGGTSGSAANTFAGVAITTNAAIAGQGVWQYSTDGNTWTDLPAVSTASALLLNPTDSLRFVPAANFHGTPGSLAARLIDSSGAAITTGDRADVADDTTKSGGTSRYSNSSNAVTLTTTVTNVNDRPTASATTLTAVNEDDANPAGATVAALGFGFADATDNQTAITGGGNAATGLGGIAIVGNAADSATQGVWQYNSGSGWTTIGSAGAAPADATALILPSSASLRFLPNVLNYNGAVGNLTVRVADSAQTFSASSNISGNLTGIDTWSASTTLGTAVTKQNDAPIATATLVNPTVTENASTGAATSIDPVNLLNAGVVTDIDLTTTAGLVATTFGAGTITATLTDGIAGDVLQISGALPTGVTVAGGTGNTPLVVTLDADTTLAEVKAVLESIQYKSTSDNPTVKGTDLTRTYTVIVNDGKNTQAGGDAGGSALAAATLTGTITITAINDAPTITDGADTAALTETNAGLSTAGTVTVNDADMDTVTATRTLAVTGTSNRADAKAPSDAALLGMLTLTPAPALNGSQTTNTLNWAFNSGAEAFNYLAAGETLVLTYTVTATDSAAATAATTVTVTITGTNDLPDITVGAGNSAAAALTETDTALSANGTLRVDDVDTFNTVAPSVISVVASGTTASLGSNNAALLAMLTVDAGAVIPNTANTGTINWAFNSGAEEFNYLTGAETLTLTYTVRATDSSAGTDDQTVVITISSSTDAPVLTVAPANVDELADASAQDLSLTGNVQVFDKDVGNTLTPSQAAPTVTWSGGALPTGVNVSALTAANVLALGGAATSTGATLNISWTYDPAAADLDWLAVGETLAVSYPLTVTDGTGGTDTKPLVITIAGTNDAPVITDGADTAALTETNTTLTATGTMTVIDRDISDTNTLTVDSVATSGTFAGTNPLTNAQLKAMLSLTAGAVASDPGASGNLVWTFTSGASGNGAFDFLGTGETLILTYTVKATDTALATDTDTVTVTITGTNDTPVAGADVAATTEDTPITIPAANLLGNDVDAEGNSITIAAVTSGSGGTAVLNGDGSVTFTPTADFNGAATFSYTVSDGSATSVAATVTVNVTAVADAVNDALTTNENIPFTINVITGNAGAGADHFENPVRTISAVTNGSGGTVQIVDAALGTLIYTPRSGFSGADSFTYTVASPAGVTETATVAVTVIANPAPAPSNHPPVANADALATTEDFPMTFAPLDLLGNDVDPNGNVIRIASVTSGTGGTAVLNGDGSVTFTPNADFNGMADFSYIATDNMLPSNSAMVMVTVNPVIDIVNDALITNENVAVTANLLNNDNFENPVRTITAVSAANHGTVEIVNAATGEVKYTPAINFSGIDNYTYTVTSPITGITETATVIVTVNSLNDPTIFGGAISGNGTEDSAISGTLTATDLDGLTDGSYFTVTAAPIHGTATIDPATGKWIYTPTADFNGADQFTVTVTDDAGNQTTQIISLTVNPVIDVVNDNLTTDKATPITADLLKNDSFENSNRVISAVTQGANGRVEIVNAATGEVKYTPNSDFTGTDSYTYTVTSPITGITETATVTITVNSPSTINAAGNEDTAINGTLIGTVFVIVGNSANGTASIDSATGAWNYTPTADFNGTDQFTVTVTDAAGNNTTQLIKLTVNPVIDVVNDNLTTDKATPITADLLKNDSFENSNRVISAVSSANHGTVQIIDAALGTVKYTPNSDFSGVDTYTYTVTSPITGITETATVTVTVNVPTTINATGNEDAAINGTLTGATFVIAGKPANGTASIDAAGKWIYTPTADFNGADQFAVTMTDATGNNTTQLIRLAVNPVIDVVNDNLTTDKATPITADLLKNDSFENSNRVISAVTQGANGRVEIINAATGEVKYTPNSEFTGTDSYTYTVTSPITGITETTTVTITVNSPNTTNAAGNEDTVINGTLIGTVFVIAGNPANGTASIDSATGAWNYTPIADFNGADQFTVTVTDAAGNNTTQIISLTVTPVNDIAADNLTTDTATPITADLLKNDSFENSNRVISAVTQGTNGRVEIVNAATGEVKYTPNSDFTGSDKYTYTVTSPITGITETATVTITVNAPNIIDAVGNEDTAINGTLTGATFVIAGKPTNGTASIDAAGKWVYTPTADFNGSNQFTVIVTDAAGNNTTQIISLTVNPVIDVVNDNLTTDKATPITANLLKNDSFENSNRVISAVTQGANGRVEIVNAATGEVKYTPNSEFTGTDSYTYTVTSPVTGITETATVAVTVNAPNVIDAVGNEDATINGTLTGAAFVIAGKPANGTASIDATGKWIYTPTADFNGADQFTMTVTDTAGNNTTQIISLTVNPVIDVVNDNLTTDKATPITADLLKNDSFENSNRVISAVTQGANGRVEIVNAATGEVKYTPNSDFTGTDSYTYTVTSPITGITETATVTITVNAPTTINATGNEDAAINGTLTGATFVIFGKPANGTASIDAAGKWIYTPTADFNGTDQFTVTVTDAAGNNTTQLIKLTVNPVIDVVNDNLTTDKATPITADLLKNDSFENSNRVISAVTQGANGRVEIINAATGEVKYTPNSDFVGTDTYTYTVTSPITGITETATVTVTVNAPSTINAAGNEDAAINGTLTGAAFVIIGNPANGTALIDATGRWIYTPTADFNGSDQFTVIVTDAAGNNTTQLIRLTVNPVIDVLNDNLTTDKATPITADLLKNDSFENSNRVISAVTQGANGRVEIVNAATGEVKYTPNADFSGVDTYRYTVNSPITGITETATVTVTVNAPNTTNEDAAINGKLTGAAFVIAGKPANGTASIDVTGKWIYTPTADFNGADQFTVTVTDAAGNNTTQLIKLAVNPVIDVVNDNLTTDKATPITADLLKNDSFENSNRVISAVTQGANGRVEIINAATGEVKYTPNSDFTGTDKYTYTVTSPITGITETATVTVTVNALTTINAAGNEDTAINGTLTGATFVIAGKPANGTASIDVTGKWIYTPTADFNGADQFTVTVTDKAGNNTTQIISLTVNPVIDVVNDNLTTNKATPITVDLLKNDSFENSNRVISAVTQGANGRVEILNAATGEVKYTPNSDFTGTDKYTYTVTSPMTGITETATVTVTVNALTTINAAGNEDTAINGTLTGATFVIAGKPANGTASIDVTGKWIYTPTADFNGSDQFTVTVADAAGNNTTQIINITVNPVIDVVNDNLTTDKATPITADLLKNDSFENSNRVISAVTQGANGRVEIINAATGEVKYTPNSDFTGTDKYTYTVTSPITGITEIATVTVTVNAPNTTNAVGNEDTAINGTLMGATFVIVGKPANGTASIDAAGKWIYTPTADFNGADQFSVTVTDAAGNNTTQLIRLTVNPVIDVVNDNLTTDKATPITADLLKNDSFENSNRVISAVTQGANGRVEIVNAATGEVKYTPNSEFTGTDSYTYTVTSPITGITETATVTVTVNAPTEQSLTVSGQASVSEGNNAIFTVTLDTVSLDATPITLTLSAGDDDAILGADYRQTPTVYYFAGDTKTTLPVTDSQLSLPAGVTTFFVNVSTINDTDYEGGERLTLTATLIDGKQDADIATILDDSTGLIYDELGAVDPSGVADDDRQLSIPDVTVNESTPYAVFRINASSNQLFSLELLNGGTEFTVGDAVATAGADYGNSLEVYDGTTWIPYTPNALVEVPEGGRTLLVRVPIFNDAAYEGAHAFTLAATLAGSTVPITGRGIIGDFGTGAIFNDSGAENRLALKDDDRSIKIDSPIINEGSGYVVFTITGTSGALDLALQLGSTSSAATIPDGIDNIQFWDGAAWRVYDGTNAAIPAAGTLLVRVGITAEQDELREGSETFDLVAIRQDENSLGKATLRDDGTGVINVFAAADDAYRGTSIINLDDDFDQDGITPTTEEALATLAASQGIGDADLGDLNHDGKQDAEQNALATLAWTTKEYFNAGNDGTLTESKAIVSIGVVESMTSDAISPISQLLDIHVEHYADIDATTEVVDNGTSKTVTLADGSTVTTPWDPIRFGIRGQDVDYNGSVDTSLTDILSDRAGLQVRVVIDVRAARVTTAEMNAYIKYVSAEAIAAAAIVDLDGNAITAPGWYDFTRRDPSSNNDGARFIVEGEQIVSIELIFTDNAFGDDDMTAGRIFDPGVPVYAEPAPTPEELLPIIRVVDPQQLEYTQPIFPAATVVRFDTLAMVPAAYVLNEVDNVRNYGKSAALRNLTTPISAEHILYVLPAVNRSQTESIWFDQTALKERLDSPEQKAGRTTQEQVKAPAIHGKEVAKSPVKPAPQDAAPPPKPVVTDGAEDDNQRTDQQEVQDAQPADNQAVESEQPSEQKTTRVNFSDQLRFAARDRSLAQQARSLGGR